MKRAIIPALALFIAAGLGCDLFRPPENGNGNGGGWKEPLTPRAVIEDIEWCYNEANANFYEILLDRDNFVFYFDPADIQDRGLPPSWTYDEEVQATRNLFDAAGEGRATISLTLSFEDSGDTDPKPNDTEFEIKDVGYVLKVFVPEKETLYLAEAYAQFTLSKFEDPITHQMRWWLTLWWDKVTW